jgi:hypothetical protein
VCLDLLLKVASRSVLCILTKAVYKAADMGFSVGIVSNAYWANSVADAEEWLRPFVGRLADLTVSSDLFHCSASLGERPQNAVVAAKWLGIPTGMISVAQPDAESKQSRGQIEDESAVMYRGRAVEKLASRATSHPWEGFDSCPHEDLRAGRPFGSVWQSAYLSGHHNWQRV